MKNGTFYICIYQMQDGKRQLSSITHDTFADAVTFAYNRLSDDRTVVDIRKVTINLYDDGETQEV